MLKEIKHNKKCRAILILVLLLFTLVICVSQIKDKKDSSIMKPVDIEELSIVSGIWKITEYLGESVEYHGTEATTNVEMSKNDIIIKEFKDKFLNKELHIDKKNIETFSPQIELGYQIMDWNDLFSIYRQPSDIWDGISPPFFCASFSLKDYDDSFGLIIDTNDIATLVVKGLFFRLEKTAKD